MKTWLALKEGNRETASWVLSGVDFVALTQWGLPVLIANVHRAISSETQQNKMKWHISSSDVHIVACGL